MVNSRMDRARFLIYTLVFLYPIFIFAGEPFRNSSCDLKTENLPKLILIGEDHEDSSSAKVRNEIMTKAGKGKYPVGLEPAIGFTRSDAFLPWDKTTVETKLNTKNSLLTGIESPIPYAVLVSYKIQSEYISKQVELNTVMNLAEYSRELPLFASALALMKEDEKASTLNISALIKKITVLSRDDKYAKMTFEERSEYFRNQIEKSFTRDQLKAFNTLHHQKVIEIVNSKYPQYYDGKPLKAILTKKDREKFGCENEECTVITRKLFELAFFRRDKDFAYNIGELLCANKDKFDGVTVIMGAGHLNGVKKHLGEMSHNRIKVEEFYSYKDNMEKILNRAASIQVLSVESTPEKPQHSRMAK